MIGRRAKSGEGRGGQIVTDRPLFVLLHRQGHRPRVGGGVRRQRYATLMLGANLGGTCLRKRKDIVASARPRPEAAIAVHVFRIGRAIWSSATACLLMLDAQRTSDDAKPPSPR
jgi:hypothetical protein